MPLPESDFITKIKGGRLWPDMPRPRQRACLDQGLKLDLNKLARQGLARPGLTVGPNVIRWTYTYTGEEIASGLISASMDGEYEGWLRIQIGSLDQRIILVPRARHLGGRQWYFVCPVMNRYASVVWMPPGATRFCSRQTWRRQVAYASQFETPVDRAYRGQAKIKSRLIADLEPDEWDLPPKPKWMRWRTYNRHEEKFDAYEDVIDQRLFALAARLGIATCPTAGSDPLEVRFRPELKLDSDDRSLEGILDFRGNF